MNYPFFFEPLNSLKLFGFDDDFNLLNKLYEKKKLPKVFMLSGNKGLGKSTLIKHFLYSIFDTKNYNKKDFSFLETSNLYSQIKNNSFPNVIFLNGADTKSVKIEDIRNLKTRIFQSNFLNKDRFIVLNDIEIFNTNSLNALLRIIEEPNEKNFFILINNKSKPILETIKSRALEFKMIFNEKKRLKIIDSLKNFHNLEFILDPKESHLTPGNFIKFNFILKELKILPSDSLVQNIIILSNLYKKNKDIIFINLIYFIIDFYFKYLIKKDKLNIDKVYEIKNFVLINLNNFVSYNINQNTLINSINNKLKL